MAKLENYDGSVELISGLKQKNDGDFPLVEANAVQTRADGTRLDAELEELRNNAGTGTGVANIGVGTGSGSVQQVADKVADGFDFTGKNARAEALDASLSAVQQYGGVGAYSSSFGGKSSAQGKRSHAEGTTTIAKGDYSHAEGNNSVTLGANSHAEGKQTTTLGENAHAEGFESFAEGYISHAEGYKTTSKGACSHAEGYGTTAEGDQSHAEGNGTFSIGACSHAEGEGAKAHEYASHAEGKDTEAKGYASHAEGISTVALGLYSHAEGGWTYANGQHSHAGGTNSIADYFCDFVHGEGLHTTYEHQTVFGRFNDDSNWGGNRPLFMIGNGTSDTARSNAFEVLNDGRAKVKHWPIDADDVLRKMDLDNFSHAATADKATAVNGFPISENADGYLIFGKLWSETTDLNSVTFAPLIHAVRTDDVIYTTPGKLDIAEGNAVQFSDDRYGKEILFKTMHGTKHALRGRIDGAYHNYVKDNGYVAVELAKYNDIPVATANFATNAKNATKAESATNATNATNADSAGYATNAGSANTAGILQLSSSSIISNREVDTAGYYIKTPKLDSGIYHVWLDHSINEYNFGTVIIRNTTNGVSMSLQGGGTLVIDWHRSESRDRFFYLVIEASCLKVYRLDSGYDLMDGWIEDSTSIKYVKIASLPDV
jgi:hypothetical protein